METTTSKTKPFLHASFSDGKGPTMLVCDNHLDDLNNNNGFNNAVGKIVHKYLGIKVGSDFTLHLRDKDHIRVTIFNSKGKATNEIKLAKGAKGDWSDQGGSQINPKTTRHAALIYETIMKRANDCRTHASRHKKVTKSSNSSPSTHNNLSSSTSSIDSNKSDSETDEEESMQPSSNSREKKRRSISRSKTPTLNEESAIQEIKEVGTHPELKDSKMNASQSQPSVSIASNPLQVTNSISSSTPSLVAQTLSVEKTSENLSPQNASLAQTPTPQFSSRPKQSAFDVAKQLGMQITTQPTKSINDINEEPKSKAVTKKQSKKKKKEQNKNDLWSNLTNLFSGRQTTPKSSSPLKTKTTDNNEENFLDYLPEGESEYPKHCTPPNRKDESYYSSSSNDDNSDNHVQKSDNRLTTTSTEGVQDNSTSDKVVATPHKPDTAFFESFSKGLEQNTTHDFDKK